MADCDSILVKGRQFTKEEIALHRKVELIAQSTVNGTLWGPKGTQFQNPAVVEMNCKQHVNIEALLSWYGVQLPYKRLNRKML